MKPSSQIQPRVLVLDVLMPGDLVLFTGTDPSSGVIKSITKSNWSHAAIAMGQGCIAEADDPGCVVSVLHACSAWMQKGKSIDRILYGLAQRNWSDACVYRPCANVDEGLLRSVIAEDLGTSFASYTMLFTAGAAGPTAYPRTKLASVTAPPLSLATGAVSRCLDGKPAQDRKLFCSLFVSLIYKRLGLLEVPSPANTSPGDLERLVAKRWRCIEEAVMDLPASAKSESNAIARWNAQAATHRKQIVEWTPTSVTQNLLTSIRQSLSGANKRATVFLALLIVLIAAVIGMGMRVLALKDTSPSSDQLVQAGEISTLKWNDYDRAFTREQLEHLPDGTGSPGLNEVIVGVSFTGAKIICERFNGRLPSSAEALANPGIASKEWVSDRVQSGGIFSDEAYVLNHRAVGTKLEANPTNKPLADVTFRIVAPARKRRNQ